jgi:hypothetical protein
MRHDPELDAMADTALTATAERVQLLMREAAEARERGDLAEAEQREAEASLLL